jgi:leucine dehydrogenase
VGVFDEMARLGHEQVTFCYDRVTGTRAIIAVHDTALGPARGGTRLRPGASEAAALGEALELSAAMTARLALGGLPRGGGRAVLLGADGVDRAAMLRVYGRFVELLGGRFGTGPDLGLDDADLAEVASQTRWAWPAGSAGEPNALAARGVAAAIGVAVQQVFGSAELKDRSVLVAGLAGVGGELAAILTRAGATVLGWDTNADNAGEVAERVGIQLVEAGSWDTECDVLCPVAAGAALTGEVLERLRCRVIAGPAGGQLAGPADAQRLHERGILWAPEQVVGAAAPWAVVGAGELGWSAARLAESADAVAAALRAVFRRAAVEGLTPGEAADLIVAERLTAGARVRALAGPPDG